jgi:ectoine hydroxylase-related dioxygenase (phytanoyl-CoA dioxygenase family)
MSNSLLHDITEEQIRQFEEDGAVCIRGQFDKDWIDRMMAAAMEHMNNPSGRRGVVDSDDGPGRLVTGTHMSRYNDEFMEIALRSPAAEIAARVMRLDELRYFYDQIIIKEAGTSVPVRWHNDMSYWPLEGNDVATVWVACTPVTVETSGLTYLAGSHKWKKVFSPPKTNYKSLEQDGDQNRAAAEDKGRKSDTDQLGECPDYDQERENPNYRFISWDMDAGDALVQIRVAFALRYFGGDATWYGPRTAFAVPGTEDNNLFEQGEPPVNDDLFPVVWRRA